MGGEAGRAPSGGLRSCACSRTGWSRHHHHHDRNVVEDNGDDGAEKHDDYNGRDDNADDADVTDKKE